MRDTIGRISRNPISLAGAALTTASALLILMLFAIELIGFTGGPYLGILAFLILPAFFVLGLLLIPVGLWRQRRRDAQAAREGHPPAAFPVIDLNRSGTRRNFLLFVAATVINVVILGMAMYKGVEVMDSTEFCGETCHSVMAPEFTTYQRSPHAHVECVACHIGPGANWFVKSKLSGTWQVVSVNLNLYPRPIPAPIENLRPARETCEQCHWPSKFVGDRLKVITHYADDEANTEQKTVLLLRVGGIQGRESRGIHWHVDPKIKIRYRADATRQTIYEVELTAADGSKRVYAKPGQRVPAEAGEWRTMDCIDCHNRPTHIYRLAKPELDQSIVEGRVDRSLPFIVREGLAALQKDYASHEQAAEQITAQLRGFYQHNYPQLLAGDKRAALDSSIAQIVQIYRTNVFPSMNIKWGTYPNHIGHEQSPGCFRCHDDEHQSADGKSISQDCFTCHSLLAQEEENPEILQQLNP
ncbi:MAG: NapC/NirT family cytochrome c [Acidobacteria bacterium]|nr:NapC/NirT family cytochrome c [Acidobacteriota bacterium]